MVIGSKQVYKNLWIEVVEDKTQNENGAQQTWGMLKILPGASVLAMDDEEYVYLTKEFHYGAGEITIEVVSGGIDKGETVLDAAKRELREEVGIEAEEWISLGVTRGLTTYSNHLEHLYLARNLKHVDRDHNETLEVVKIPFKTACQWVCDSTIIDSYSGTLILRAAEYLKKNKKI